MRTSRIKPAYAYTLIIVLVLMLIVLLAEIGARHFKVQAYSKKYPAEPNFNLQDRILGWKPKPGVYDYPGYTAQQNNIRLTILEDGRRATKISSQPAHNTKNQTILFTGCSFTFGKAISDHETFAWKLQTKYPSLDIRNYGVSGHSTYQTLLRLREILPQIKTPKIIVYGFIKDHEIRNVAPDSWLPDRLMPIPFVFLDSKDNIVESKTQRFFPLPFRNKLAGVMWLESLGKKLLIQDQNIKTEKMPIATTKLVQELNYLSNKFGAKFHMVILNAPLESRQYYLELMPKLGISIIDCSHTKFENLKIAGEGHPNEEMNDIWANCINSNLNLAGLQ